MSLELNPLESRERHVIEPGSEILGGILLTRAGIVVDTEENPQVYEAVLAGVDERLARRSDIGTPIILKAIKAEASQRVMHHVRGYAKILNSEAEKRGRSRLGPEDEIGLSTFMSYGIGICQQHALLSGATVRMLQQRGDLGDGAVSLESGRPGPLHPDRHVMVDFSEAESGETFTIEATGVSSDMRTLAFIW